MFQRVLPLLLLATVCNFALVGCGSKAPIASPAHDNNDVNYLMSQLEREAPGARVIAARRLADQGKKAEAALPKLRELAENDPSEQVRIVAGESIQRISGN